MVEDRRHALFDGVNVKCGGGCLRAVHHQLAVDRPPGAVEHLIEIGGVVADDRKTAGKRGIDVRVSIDERGHDHAALGVDDLGAGVLGAQCALLADFDDRCAFIGDGAVFVVALSLAVTGDESAVGDKIHNTASSWMFEIDYDPAKKKSASDHTDTSTLFQRESDRYSPCAKHFVAAINLNLQN